MSSAERDARLQQAIIGCLPEELIIYYMPAGTVWRDRDIEGPMWIEVGNSCVIVGCRLHQCFINIPASSHGWQVDYNILHTPLQFAEGA